MTEWTDKRKSNDYYLPNTDSYNGDNICVTNKLKGVLDEGTKRISTPRKGNY